MNPLVSVILITKNEEKYIAGCLKSLLAQKYKNIEALIVDNHSGDNTLEIARQTYKKVKIFWGIKRAMYASKLWRQASQR